MQKLVEATEALGDAGRLRSMLDRDGYVFLPGLLSRERVARTRLEVLQGLAKVGWLRAGEPLDAAAPSAKAIPEGVAPFDVYFEAYAKVQSIQSYHELAHEPEVLAVMADLFGVPVLAQPMKILRLGVSTPERWTTPSHQDFPIIDGTVDFVTAWIPLGDCEPALGGLKILPGSHRAGRMEVLPATGVGAVRVEVDEDDERFCTAEYEMGDVLIFHSLTVHGALPNTVDRIRVSADFRYQALTAPLREAMLHPHYGGLIPDWDVLTEGWTSDHSWVTPEGVVIADDNDRAPVTPTLVHLDAGASA